MFTRGRVRPAALAACAVAVLSVAAGCGSDDDSSTSASTGASTGASTAAAPAASGPEMVIGYSNPAAAEEGLRSVGVGEQKAIELLGLNWTVKELDAKLSADKQVSDVDSFISQGVDGITTWTLDPGAVGAAYTRAQEAGIPLIGLNSESDTFASEVAADSDTTCKVADEQAAFIAEKAPGAKVLAIGGPPVPSITLTTECFEKAAEAEGLEIVDLQNDTQATPASGQQLADGMLVANSDVQAMWVFSESSALGAAAALKAAGKTIASGDEDGVVLVSRNGTAAAAKAIEAGELTATWDNNQPLLGAAAIQLLKYHLVDGVPLDELPKTVPIPSKMWDKANIGEYQPPLEREIELPLPETFEGA